MADDIRASDRIRYGYGPNIAVSRAVNVQQNRYITLEMPQDAVFFHSGMTVLFGLRDDGRQMREKRGRVEQVERMNGVVRLSEPHPTLAIGDFLFTDPPGAQVDPVREAFAMAVKAEAELLQDIANRMIALAGGKR